MIARVWLLIFFLASPAWATFDNSDYRTSTYGAPTHYCDLTLSIAAPSGAGTVGDPWNATRCMTEPVAGNVVGILPVGAGTPVSLTAPNSAQNAAFKPTNSGTSGNPIVYVTKYAAVALDRSTITTNQNRSEIRHAGTATAADVAGTGGPTYGVNGQNYITFDGFFVDASQAHFRDDSGVISLRSCTGCQILNFVLKGEVTDCDSNCIYIRTDAMTNGVYKNFVVYGYDNQPTGAGLNQQGFAGMQYGDQNFLMENFLIDGSSGADEGWFFKGTSGGGTVFNYGTIRYGEFKDTLDCIRFNDFHATNLTTIDHVLCHHFQSFGIGFTTVTSHVRNVLMHHVTIADGCQDNANCAGNIYLKDEAGSVSNATFRDNLIDTLSGSNRAGVGAGEATYALPTLNYNGYYFNAAGNRWTWNGTNYTVLATWQSATGETNTSILATDPFTNRASNDYSVAGGHAALTASSTGGEIGAYEGTNVIGIDLSAGSGTSIISGSATFSGSVRIQ